MATHDLSFFHSLRPIPGLGRVLLSPVNDWLGGERESATNKGKIVTIPYDTPVIVLPKRGQSRIGCAGRFRVPRNYVGTPVINLVWATDAPANALQSRLEVDARGVAATELLDQAAAEAVAVNAAGQDVAFELTQTAFPFTGSTFAAQELAFVGIFRDHLQAPTNDDTVLGPIYLYDALFTYNDV